MATFEPYRLTQTGAEVQKDLNDIEALAPATTEAAGLMSAEDKTKLDGIASGAEANVIETVKVNGTAIPPVNKAVDIDTKRVLEIKSIPESGQYTVQEFASAVCDNTDFEKLFTENYAFVRVNGPDQHRQNPLFSVIIPQNDDINNKPIALVGDSGIYLIKYSYLPPIITDITVATTYTAFPTSEQMTAWGNKQNALVSGSNIKTVNGNSILGSGNLDVKDIFIAEYDVTTLAQVLAAIEAGKMVFVDYGGVFYVLTDYNANAALFFRFADDTELNIVKVSSGGWDDVLSFFPENSANKVESLSAQSTNDQYPSAKCVYDALAAKYTKPAGGIPASDLASGVIPEVQFVPGSGTGSAVLKNAGLEANNHNEVAVGRNNFSGTGNTDADKTIFSVGVGSIGKDNAIIVKRDGKVYLKGGGYMVISGDEDEHGEVQYSEFKAADLAQLVSQGGLGYTQMISVCDHLYEDGQGHDVACGPEETLYSEEFSDNILIPYLIKAQTLPIRLYSSQNSYQDFDISGNQVLFAIYNAHTQYWSDFLVIGNPNADWNAASGSPAYIKNKPAIPSVTGKADKVSGATSGNFAGLDSNGNLTDSGKKAADFQPTIDSSHKLDYGLLSNTPPSVPTPASGDNGKVLGVTDGQGSLGWVAQSGGGGGVQDVTLGGTSVVSQGTAVLPAYPTVPTISTDISTDGNDDTKTASPKAVYDEVHPALQSTQPVGGFLPNVVYDLGELTGTVTFALASPTDNSIPNPYHWTFDTGSTAPTITWPSGIIWPDDFEPGIDTNKHYEVFVRKGYASMLIYSLPTE